MTHELQSTLEASGIEWPVLRNPIQCMAHVIPRALGAFMISLRVKGRTKSWEAHERNQQFGENDRIDIRKSQRLRKEGNATINKVLAMKPGFAKIIEKVRISRYFESPETDLHIAQNACSIDYADTRSPTRVHWLSKSQSLDYSTPEYGCEETLKLNTEVAWARLPSTGIHTWVAPISWTHRLPATFHNSRWMHHCEVYHGSIEAISILDLLDVEEVHSHSTSSNYSVQWQVRSYGWCDVSSG